MSTTWDVYCATCHHVLGLELSRAENAFEMIRARGYFEQMEGIGAAFAGSVCYPEITIANSGLDIDWFPRHLGHFLVARNGYGELIELASDCSVVTEAECSVVSYRDKTGWCKP